MCECTENQVGRFEKEWLVLKKEIRNRSVVRIRERIQWYRKHPCRRKRIFRDKDRKPNYDLCKIRPHVSIKGVFIQTYTFGNDTTTGNDTTPREPPKWLIPIGCCDDNQNLQMQHSCD